MLVMRCDAGSVVFRDFLGNGAEQPAPFEHQAEIAVDSVQPPEQRFLPGDFAAQFKSRRWKQQRAGGAQHRTVSDALRSPCPSP